jgi:hypothetical protein
MNKLYLLNEATHHQIECNTVCQRLYNHLASLHRENGKFRSSIRQLSSAWDTVNPVLGIGYL